MTKQYGVILADPPWQYKQSGGRGHARHYAGMADSDIRSLPVASLALSDAVLLLWSTWPMLPVAMSIIPAWGFEYVTGIPWVKTLKSSTPECDVIRPQFGTGWWFRGASEPLLVARRGSVRPPKEWNWAGIMGPRIEHSRKPESAHQFAESLPGPYLELFARRAKDGWDVWGLEAPGEFDPWTG